MRIFLLLLALGAAACGSSTDLALDRSTPVPIYARIDVAGAPFAVHFAGVSQDSRCPRNAMCIWAGDAVAQVDLVAPGDSVRVALHTSSAAGATSTTFHDYVVELVALDPVPEAGKPTDPTTYVATIRIKHK